MIEIIVPPQWTRLGVEEFRGTVMIVGASDTGKSMFARYLYQLLCEDGVRAAYLDADVGQGTLGLPTTMTVALSSGPGDARFPPQGARVTYSVGSTTPRGQMLPTVIGAYRLRQKALALGAEVVLVDTTGLVDRTQGGKALKQWKIELLAPSLVIGLQRGRELEPILWPLRRDGRLRCIELPVSPNVVERSREARMARRRERLARYFEGAQQHLMTLQQVAVYDLERLAVGALLALQDAEGFAVGMGVAGQADRLAGKVGIHTPLSSLDGVVSLRFGTARWDLINRREMQRL